MNVGKRLLYSALGLLSLLIVGAGTVYGIKPGDCHPVKKGPYDKVFNTAFLYGGNSSFRAKISAKLYESGYFRKIIPLGTDAEVDLMKSVLIEYGVPPDDIVQPVGFSYDTFTNIQSGNDTVVQRELDDDIAHLSGPVHLNRIGMLNEKLAGSLDSSNDGYFPLEGDVFGQPVWKFPNPRNSDMAAWYACIRDGRRVD